jgi:predicted lipoprotein with Yx(FWY)xxD motif
MSEKRKRWTLRSAHSACLAGASSVLLMHAATASEAFRSVPIPPGVRVSGTELDGPVFTDSKGRTLYQWPLLQMRNGVTGDHLGTSECVEVKTEVSAGLMSPYPPGLRLPELGEHPSCTRMWPPFLADAAAQPIGKWTIIKRKDGSRQWAYEDLPVYTFYLDRRAGDVLGARADRLTIDTPALRRPVGPPPDVPPGFAVKTMSTGRLLVTEEGSSVYYTDGDAHGKSSCDASCAEIWIPLLAPSLGQPHGEFSLFERSPGIRQWAYRGRPLYRYALDGGAHRLKGSDVPGWHNVYTQLAPRPPAEFTAQDTTAGQVLADSSGRTIYTYFCGDDGQDQLECDHPGEASTYRLAVCGGGDAQRCLQTFPYVIASSKAKSTSLAWTVMLIDPATGRQAPEGQPGALRVWAYRDRPVYTYAGDRAPGEVNGDSHGEFRAERNGYRAFWLRDDFFNRDQPGPG